jgi:hypothetical protein
VVYRLDSFASFAWWTNSQSRPRNMVKHTVISRRWQTRWIYSLVVWMWGKIEKVLKIFSFRPELHAGTKLHVRRCCLFAVPASVLTAAFADVEGLVTRCFQDRRNHFIHTLQPSHLHMYRAVCFPYFVFIRRWHNSGLPPSASLVTPLHEWEIFSDDIVQYMGNLTCMQE